MIPNNSPAYSIESTLSYTFKMFHITEFMLQTNEINLQATTNQKNSTNQWKIKGKFSEILLSH